MFGRYIISNSAYVLIFLWYNRQLFFKKQKKKEDVFIILFLIFIKSFINLYKLFQFNLIITILTYIIISTKFFIGSITKKSVFIGSYICITFISEIIAFWLLNIILSSNAIASSVIYNMIGSILSTLFLIIIINIITKFNDIKDMIDNREFLYFMTLPLISIIIIFTIMQSDMLSLNPNICILVSLGIILFNLIICIGFADIIKSRNIQLENEKLKGQKLHYELLEEKFDNSRRFIHDFKKHINLINGYINNHEYTKLNSYLGEITEEIKKDESFVITGNQIIDLTLNTNKEIFLQNNIDIKHDVRIREVRLISAFDFNVIFSNILENSIESCINSNGNFIKIKLESNNGLVILKVINPCTKINKNLKTMKCDVDYHGCGIKNINKIVHKYNGSSTFEFDNDNHLFISTIILDISS